MPARLAGCVHSASMTWKPLHCRLVCMVGFELVSLSAGREPVGQVYRADTAIHRSIESEERRPISRFLSPRPAIGPKDPRDLRRRRSSWDGRASGRPWSDSTALIGAFGFSTKRALHFAAVFSETRHAGNDSLVCVQLQSLIDSELLIAAQNAPVLLHELTPPFARVHLCY